MIIATARLLERHFKIPAAQSVPFLSRATVLLAAGSFLLVATLIVAFDSFIASSLASLQVGSVAPSDIHAPETRTYPSAVLTEQRRRQARDSVLTVYRPPDSNVARLQSQLAVRILDFIENVRRDPYGTADQRIRDIEQITALQLSPETIAAILDMSDEVWSDVKGEVQRLLEQVMQDSIRESDIPGIRERLPIQVSLRFDDEVGVIVAIVEDLLRPNRVPDVEATEAAREAAAAAVPEVIQTYQRGQIIVPEGQPISADQYEALQQMGLLLPAEGRVSEIVRAFFGVLLAMALTGLHLARFRPSLLYSEPRLLTLLGIIFVLVLAGMRFSLNGQIYLFPSAILALLYVAIIGPEIAIIGSLGLAFLSGLMANNSLEIATLVMAGGMIGALILRRPERLNNYFAAGLMVAIVNITSAAIFNITIAGPVNTAETSLLVLYAGLNGVLTTAATLVSLYLIGQIFNLPTALRLIELSQPNQPLLQRLLREAPGTYQHSLQVANLCEQAATAVGANSELVHVAALYHDIGKMNNPAFFTENQRDIGNPHDVLDDPYRSADIIISHVTEGDELARQYRLPNRIREFIREHHGTTQVYVFYQRALNAAGDDKREVDPEDFTYPGPRPRSRETAIMMLADSAEATIRAIQPKTRQEIEETIERIIEDKRKSGQLDESGLTLDDLAAIKRIFVDILKAIFHPRIDYREAVSKARDTNVPLPSQEKPALRTEVLPAVRADEPPKSRANPLKTETVPKVKVPAADLPDVDDDDSPLAEVPPLPRANGKTREIKPAEPDPNHPAAAQNGIDDESPADDAVADPIDEAVAGEGEEHLSATDAQEALKSSDDEQPRS